nr:DNA helicase MCM9 [Maniola hyperantus]
MDILKAEIARKRKLLEEKNILNSSKKYFKRGELLAKEQEEYYKKYGPQKHLDKLADDNNQIEDIEKAKKQETDEQTESVALPRAEVIKRLRERAHPIILFGESELQAFRRLRRIEIQEPEANRGLRNDFQEAMDKVDQAYLNEILALGTQNESEKPQNEDDLEDSVTYEFIQEMAKTMGQGDRNHDMNVIMILLQFLLKLWGQQLNSGTATEKTAIKHKMTRATYTQTQVYLKPLMRKLKKKTLPEDICDSLMEITKHLLERNYIMASDAYLQMAIGNAPWPIGVTMVGIHARTGREKIFSKNVAHVMNDETQRKYIQALKRLMTKCQEYFPTDPSRCVEYSTARSVGDDGVFCITMCVGFMSSGTEPPEMKPLSTHIIGLKCCSWSDVITLKVVPVMSVPTGSETGTVTTPFESVVRRDALIAVDKTVAPSEQSSSASCSAAFDSESGSATSTMILEYVTKFHLQDCLNILSEQDVLGYYSIKIDFLKLFETYPDVGDKVLCSPVSTLKSCNEEIIKAQQNILEKDEYKSMIDKLSFKYLKRNVHARFFGLPVCPELHRTVFPKNIDLGCFLKVTGTTVRVTQAKMLEYQRKYICMKCKFENTIEANFENRYIIKAPTKCWNSNIRCKCSTFTQVNLVSREHCKDYQEIKIQEQVNKLSIGTIPGSMWVVLEDDLVDTCKPGDDVIICGTVRRRWRPSVQAKKSEVELVLQANYIEVINAQRSEVIAMAPDVKDCFDDFWAKYQQCPLKGRDQILASVCPQVYGLYLVKLAVLLTVITGSNHIAEKEQNTTNDDKHASHVRGQCHLLLVGDPGTGKSQLLKASAELTPRSVFTSGAGSTRAGLTCAALREDGEWQLEAGALVLSDGGVCCIDEISHLRDHDRTAIHEAMEQQTISVAKAGIVCKLNSRCAVIAACNPKGHYQTDQPLSVNVSLGTPLLSRFDLIFILLDSKNRSWDKLVSSYILFGDDNKVESKTKWTIEKLQMYIGLIGPRHTQMTKSANTILQCYYMTQRKSENRDPSRTTVRMLDSLIRLSQAHCRLMYRTTILPIDAIFAISLVDLSMQDCTLEDTVDALHSTFLKYPDFDYLCTAKKLLTKLNLIGIWKEELFYYGKLLQIDLRTLENDIERGNYKLFTKYDDVSDDNIPLTASLITSSYFNNNKNGAKVNEKNNKGPIDIQEGNVKVMNEKLAATLKKHATLNKIDKKLPTVQKKNSKRKRKEVIIDTSEFGNKKQRVTKKKQTKVDTSSDSDECDVNKMLNAVPSVNDVFADLGIDFKLCGNGSYCNSSQNSDKNISTKAVIEHSVLNKENQTGSNSNDKKIAEDNQSNEKVLNTSLSKLKQFEFAGKRDLSKFYDENVESNKDVINSTVVTSENSVNKNSVNSFENPKKPVSSSQLSMFESSDCDIDFDI